jgi:hypothetical protein
MEDLDGVIVLDREALDLRPQGHSDRSWSLNNLAFYLSTLYPQLGVMEVLDEAIDICKLPGLSRFLLPSLFPDLQRAADGGPVIIVNASMYSCDALIVFFDRDRSRPYSVADHTGRCSRPVNGAPYLDQRADVMSKLAFFLRKLWDQIVSPIVHFLQTTHPSHSRIW